MLSNVPRRTKLPEQPAGFTCGEKNSKGDISDDDGSLVQMSHIDIQ